ncbi:unnamed protein product [Meganyctiphanes norvegica]|uniref:Ubiquitin-conjugating enzyme E2 J2 n=1 Tax=Meganyctiphanes norvegica TaxID=48144 RepID=A0AAV2S6C2_MEGNR
MADQAPKKIPNFGATKRLKKDYQAIEKDPVPYVVAKPLDDNILEWHYVVQGPEETPYIGGYYHGKVIFPDTFPFKPPEIQMITPSGRFQINRAICLSMSSFHPETWNPAWTVGAILKGLQSFMMEDTNAVGTVQSSDEEKKRLAKESLNFNLKNNIFVKLFPQFKLET